MRTTLPSRRNSSRSFSNVFGGADPRHVVIGLILLTALLAFELFNFDTTRYALGSLLGNVTFVGITWATILAIAFCAIDFAGLARLFTPERGANEPKEVWYLMGAWLLGATMNAVMTWWAVSLTLLDHPLGNEILGREQLLQIVPIFVAVLVWLTRILFIGSLTVAGEQFFEMKSRQTSTSKRSKAPSKPSAPKGTGRTTTRPPRTTTRRPTPAASFSPADTQPAPMVASAPAAPVRQTPASSTSSRHSNSTRNSRVRRRPPTPGNMGPRTSGMKAKPNNYS